MTTPEQLKAFVQLVKHMRTAQKDFFNGARTSAQLRTARRLESQVDEMIKQLTGDTQASTQSQLF